MSKDLAELFGSEFGYIKRLGSAFSDPEEKRNFWEHVKAKKLENENWSIYDEFPRSESATKRAMLACCDYVRSLRHPEREEEDVG